MLTITFTLEELPEVAQKILEAKPQSVILFEAEMGVGKTTLIKEIAKQLGVSENTNSPTYLIVNEYHSDSGNIMYHFDAYRLKHEEEAYAMGFDEYLDSGNYCFIEWPDRMGSIIPEVHTKINIQRIDEQTRLLKMS